MLVTGLGSVANGSGKECFTDNEEDRDDAKDVGSVTHGPRFVCWSIISCRKLIVSWRNIELGILQTLVFNSCEDNRLERLKYGED